MKGGQILNSFSSNNFFYQEAMKKIKNISNSRKNGVNVNSSVQETSQKTSERSSQHHSTVDENKNTNNSNAGTSGGQNIFTDFNGAIHYFSSNAKHDPMTSHQGPPRSYDDFINPTTSAKESNANLGKNHTSSSSENSDINPFNNIPRTFFANEEEDSDIEMPRYPSSSSAKGMTRKIAPISSKFIEAHDTLTLLKSLSQKASLIMPGTAVGGKGQNTFNAAKNISVEDIGKKEAMNENSLQQGNLLSQADDFGLGLQFNQMRRNDTQSSQSNTDVLNQPIVNFSSMSTGSEMIPQSNNDDEADDFRVPFQQSSSRAEILARGNLSTVLEIDNDSEEDGSKDSKDDSDSETCESSGEEEPKIAANGSRDANQLMGSGGQGTGMPHASRQIFVESPKEAKIVSKFDDHLEWSEGEEEEDKQETYEPGYPAKIKEKFPSVPGKSI